MEQHYGHAPGSRRDAARLPGALVSESTKSDGLVARPVEPMNLRPSTWPRRQAVSSEQWIAERLHSTASREVGSP